MEGEVPWTGARFHRRRRRIVGRERSGRGIEAELLDEIAAEAGRQHEAIGGVGLDGVGIGLGRDDLLRRLHGAVGRDRVHRDLVVGVGGGEQEAAAAVGGDVGHAAIERAVGDVAELAGRGIDAKARRHHRLAARGGEQEFLVRAYGHRRRARRLGDAGNRHLLDRREVAVLRIELQDVDLVAVGAARHRRRSRPSAGSAVAAIASVTASAATDQGLLPCSLPERSLPERSIGNAARDDVRCQDLPHQVTRPRFAGMAAIRAAGSAVPRRPAVGGCAGALDEPVLLALDHQVEEARACPASTARRLRPWAASVFLLSSAWMVRTVRTRDVPAAAGCRSARDRRPRDRRPRR